jgi:hypothetical protein
MRTLQIEILHPKAAKLLKDLEEMDLISIKKPAKKSLSSLLEKLRSKESAAPSLEEITKEVDIVRSKRYGKEQ